MEIIVNQKSTSNNYKIKFVEKLNRLFGIRITKYQKVAILTDNNLYKSYERYLKINNILLIKVSPGELSKSIETKVYIEDLLFKNGFNRKSLIIAFGGGVIGDLGGYVASTFMRGIDIIHVPTSLISIVDSAIGGKTGIDNKFGKNLIGTFYNPKEIIVNKNFLKTLPKKEIRQGLAEIIKYGIIQDKSLIRLLENIEVDFIKNTRRIQDEIIKKCINIKVKVVREDFKESNKRMILNFGHTIGHAIEKYYKYKKSHGDCIGIGMLIESKIATDIGILSEKDYSKIKNILLRFNLLSLKLKPTSSNKLIDNMKLDKKNKTNKITFVLPEAIGKIRKWSNSYSIEIPEKIIRKSVRNALNEIKN
ncbi:MAG: 3-dehydroquinate synthase [Thermodesulfobacteriota bacterium]|nr:3-dehydroquinate synthase [Thermodesulfobacteriota bacterium]